VRHLNGTTQPLWLADLRRLNGTRRLVIEQLFLTAIATCDTLEAPGPAPVRSIWPKFAHGWLAYSSDPDDQPEPAFVPTPADHDRMLVALSWGNALDKRQWRIAADVAQGFSWEAIGVRRHLPVATVLQAYGRALDAVVAAALID